MIYRIRRSNINQVIDAKIANRYHALNASNRDAKGNLRHTRRRLKTRLQRNRVMRLLPTVTSAISNHHLRVNAIRKLRTNRRNRRTNARAAPSSSSRRRNRIMKNINRPHSKINGSARLGRHTISRTLAIHNRGRNPGMMGAAHRHKNMRSRNSRILRTLTRLIGGPNRGATR